MEEKKEKWEIQFENYQNGELDKELEELKSKYDNKEIDFKKYTKEQKRFDKIKSNLTKVENLLEFRNELKNLKSEIENELVERENEAKKVKDGKNIESKKQKLDQENAKLLQSIEDTKKQLKNKNLSDNERQKLEDKLNKDNARLKENNKEYSELNAKSKNNDIQERNSELSKMSKGDLKKNYQKVCMQLSRNSFYAKRLLKGYDIENIKVEDKKIDWKSRKYNIDMKKLMAKGKDAEKMKELKEVAKEEKITSKEEKTGKAESRSEDEGKKIEKKIGDEVNTIINSEKGKEDDEIKKEETALMEVDEFAKKHPRLAKIRNFFKNITDKFNKKDEKENPKDEKENPKDEKENPKDEKTGNKHKDFVKSLRDIEQYEMADVAEKGMDAIQEERMSEAKKRLLENKIKSAEASKAKYEQGLNNYYKNHNINKTITDNTNYMDPSIKDEGR